MTVAAFDTLKVATRLKAAEFSEKQAEAVVAAMSEAAEGNFKDVATKDDLKVMGTEMKAVEDRLTAKIQLSASELKTEIAVLKNDASHLKLLFRLGLGMGLAMLYRLFFMRGAI
jgi:hypothetical protein